MLAFEMLNAVKGDYIRSGRQPMEHEAIAWRYRMEMSLDLVDAENAILNAQDLLIQAENIIREIEMQIVEQEERLERAHHFRDEYERYWAQTMLDRHTERLHNAFEWAEICMERLEYAEWNLERVEKQLAAEAEEADKREESALLHLLRSVHRNPLFKGEKATEFLLKVIEYTDNNDNRDCPVEEWLRIRYNALGLMAKLTKMPMYTEEANWAKKALQAYVDKVKENAHEEGVESGEISGCSLSMAEDAMVALIDVRADALRMAKRHNISYEDAVIMILDPDPKEEVR